MPKPGARFASRLAPSASAFPRRKAGQFALVEFDSEFDTQSVQIRRFERPWSMATARPTHKNPIRTLVAISQPHAF